MTTKQLLWNILTILQWHETTTMKITRKCFVIIVGVSLIEPACSSDGACELGMMMTCVMCKYRS